MLRTLGSRRIVPGVITSIMFWLRATLKWLYQLTFPSRAKFEVRKPPALAPKVPPPNILVLGRLLPSTELGRRFGNRTSPPKIDVPCQYPPAKPYISPATPPPLG